MRAGDSCVGLRRTWTGFLVSCVAFGAATVLAVGAERDPGNSTVLADLPREVRTALAEASEAVAANADPQDLLRAVYLESTPYEFSGGSVVARTDGRWFATLPPAGDGAPLLELRRWPGDSVLTLYAVKGEPDDGTGYAPPVANARWTRRPGGQQGVSVWEGILDTAVGERPALWVEQTIASGQPRLGSLLLPGDAGFGPEGVPGLREELLAVLGRVEVRPAPWKTVTVVAGETNVLVPTTLDTPGAKTEEEQPWQVVRASGFTVGLPPGFRTRRMDGSVPAPDPLDGGLLWFRGRCLDSEGTLVAVGDATRYGYVARVDDPKKDWLSGTRVPLVVPSAERITLEEYGLAKERTQADRVTAERWREVGFAGEWLVFRLQFPDHGYEIGLPVLSGSLSPSLYWIPAMWRDETRAPAPPPVDPAQRFGIRFERLTRADRQRHPWVEGYLVVPGLRASVSDGWVPAASLRSSDGYPVRFMTYEGEGIGSLSRVSEKEIESAQSELHEAEELEKAGRHRAVRVLYDGRGTHLFVAKNGHGFLFKRDDGSGEADEVREQWSQMMQSVRLEPD